ncbi:MAG: hypothetical protein K9I26_07975 [Flavobacterium sp.]|nr:hypothetical protein [Flavobacterium sp.]
MKNSILILLLLLVCQLTFSQKLVYKNRGNIKDVNGNNLSTNEVRSLLTDNETLLEEYNIGRTKKTVGNVLLLGGATLSYGVLAVQFSEGKPVSTGLVAVGLISMLVAIPVKIGFTKKIKHVVSEFNSQKLIGETNFKIRSTDFIANSNGLGFRLTFN